MNQIFSGEQVVLQHGSTKAEILTPWSTRYRYSRFAHSGFITGLWLGDTCFTQAERAQAGQLSTGGIGLCSEYKCPKVEMDSAVGEEFLKIGSGVIRRPEEPWSIVDLQQIQSLPTSLTVCDDAAVFECISPVVNGYGYREKRTITLRDGILRQEYEMENTADKVLEFSEYCHNFVSLGDLQTDETHRLELFGARKLSSGSAGFLATDDGAGWAGPVEGSFSAPCEMTAPAPGIVWRLSSSRTCATIEEETSFAPSSMYLWGTEYCISAEVFHSLCIQPGETARWSREWHVSK